VLRRPSNEAWFDPWVDYLRSKRVLIHTRHRLLDLQVAVNAGKTGVHSGERNCIMGAILDTPAGQTRIKADHYILAINPFDIAHMVQKNASLSQDQELAKFKGLVQDGPHVQVSFRIGFDEPVAWEGDRVALIFSDSEFNLTIFRQDELWAPDASLGKNLKSLWSGTACMSFVPGGLYAKDLTRLTKAQFMEEVWRQIAKCADFQTRIKSANHGRHLASFQVIHFEVWHSWLFPKEGTEGSNPSTTLTAEQPKWVNSCHTQPFMPNASTSFHNLFLAGAHTRTSADLWSMEGAAESGRRSAFLAMGYSLKQAKSMIWQQHVPLWMGGLRMMDNTCWRIGMPNIVDVLMGVICTVVVLFIVMRGCARR